MTEQSVQAGWHPDPYGDSSIVRWWDGAQWTDRTQPGLTHLPPPKSIAFADTPAGPTTAPVAESQISDSNRQTSYDLAEDGRNGTVEVQAAGLERKIKRIMGKTDIEFIPWKAITSISHDRKSLGTDKVTLHTSGRTFEWRVKRSGKAKEFVAEVRSRMG